MQESDKEKFFVEMCIKYPNKFSDDDLSYWFRELSRFNIHDVMEVVTAWKAENKYVPKMPEIKARLGKRAGSVTKSNRREFTNIIAQIFAANNPKWSGCSEPWLIFKFYYVWFCKRRKDYIAQAVKAKRQLKPFEQCQCEELTASYQSNVYRELWGIIPKDDAKRVSEFIGAPRDQVEACLAELETIALVEPEPEITGEIPSFEFAGAA